MKPLLLAHHLTKPADNVEEWPRVLDVHSLEIFYATAAYAEAR